MSRVSKLGMPAWGLSAKECKTGTQLNDVEGAICNAQTCYAKKFRFLFDNVQNRLGQAKEGMKHPLWVPAGIYEVSRLADKEFRLFHSGDIQDINHTQNILTICENVRDVIFWLPTREKQFILPFKELILNEITNLRIRASATLLDGPPPTWWPMTSTVITTQEPGPGICPAPEQDHKCEGCRACTDTEVKNVAYRMT